ncbi:MAG: c-type cytochrome [Acidobacteria bacterium]|nr:c-type cytochrome [Acidobacteriota bacterium]MBV9481066.1 c-type cytochrome [Acidobacteriota bacterium]
MQTDLALWSAVAGMLMLLACSREERQFRPSPPASEVINSVQVSGLNPGANPVGAPAAPEYYQESAYAVSQGKTLFNEYNCSGCHANGGGGIGPPLMDNYWIYGSEPGNIFTTIIQGRPNGMPSFRNRIPEFQAWEIVAYVRSLSGLLPKDVAPSRSDQFYVKPPEQSMPYQVPTGITGKPEPPK